jgi:hypothetical protein
MTPGEVNGLQSLAMAQGGSLTINPETGLPEAGILRSLLPMIAGFALGPAGFALMSAPMAGLAVGAATGLATGSLKDGIMAGIGAYGGAGLGAGLMSQGAGAVDDVALASKNAAANTPAMNVANTGVEGMKANLYGQGKGIFSTTPSAASNAMTGFPASAPPIAPIHSGGISSVPTALQGSGPGGFGAAQPGVFTPGSLGGTAIPAPAPGPVTISRVPSEIYGEQPAKFLTNLPQAAPYKGEYITAGKVGDVVPKAYTNKPILNITEMQRNAAAVTPKTLATDATVNAADVTMPRSGFNQLGRGFEASTKDFEGLKGLYKAMPQGSVIASGMTLAEAMKPEPIQPKKDKSLIRPYEFDYGSTNISGEPYSGSAERVYFNPTFTALTPYEAPGPEYAAKGGLMGYAVGGPVEQMAALNAVGANTGYPMANLQTPMYSNPTMQRPEATNVIAPSADAGVGAYSGEQRFAVGGVSHLGDYSDGGRLLKGPGDGVSDSIPASIGNRQPARLADGEFVVPARIVSEIGNGSTEAGARKLYAMMDRVQKARRRTVGKNQVARNTKAEKLLPA